MLLSMQICSLTLPALQNIFVDFSSNLPGDLALTMVAVPFLILHFNALSDMLPSTGIADLHFASKPIARTIVQSPFGMRNGGVLFVVCWAGNKARRVLEKKSGKIQSIFRNKFGSKIRN